MRTLKSFCIVSVFLAITAYAQEETRYERGATVLENTLPAAPEACSVVKYTDVPVFYSSGRVQMSVPVWTLQGREINVPISLRYSSGGIKMEDIAGVAGLGWSLDAGGCIIRDITYLPDEFFGVPTGRFYTRPSSEQLSNLINQTDTSGTLSFLRDVLWNRRDPSPDRYSYSFCGLSGSFILTPDNEVVQLSGDGVVITFDSSNDIFRITGPDGTRYTFAARETGTKETPYGPGTPTSGQNSTWTATTAWYLTQITSRTGLESAVFSYSSAGTWNRDSRVHSRTMSVTLGSGYIFPQEHLTSTFSTTLSSYQSLVLSSITLGDFQATFQYDTENSQTLLVSGASAAWNFPRRLRRITVKGPGDAPSYLLHARELTRLEVFTDRDSYDGRILLDSLQVYRGGTLDDRWAFSYKRPFRRANRYSCDWYGYFNGECGDGDQFYHEGQTFPNRTDACPFKLEISSGGYLPKLSYGLPNDAYSDYLMLLESNHNGAVTGFEYEGNKMGGVMLNYYGSGTVTQIDTVSVGVRVKSITVSDGQGAVRKRRFRYGGPVATGPIVPLIGDYTTYDAIQSIESFGPGGLNNAIYTWSFTIHEHPSVSGASIQGTSLVYSRVQEDAYDPLAGESAGTARSVMSFGAAACAPVTHNVYSRFPSKWSYAYNQASSYLARFGAVESGYSEISPQEEAVLLRKEEYAWDARLGYYLITTEDNTYGNTSWSDVLTGYEVKQVMQPYTYGTLAYSDMYHFPIWSHSTKGRALSSTERINYVQGTPIDTTVITYGQVMRTTLEKPSRVNLVSISGSDGYRTVQISYADNLAGLTNYGGVGGWADSLASQHYLIEPIRKEYTRFEPTPPPLEGGSGSLPGPYIPEGISRTKTETLTSFAWFPAGTAGGNNILMPSVTTEMIDRSLVWKEEIFSYDIMGRPTEIKERGRPRTAILWGYRGMHPLAAIENATLNDIAKAYSGSSNPQQGKILLDALSYAKGPTNSQIATIEALRQVLDSAHVSTFTYIPGIGAASISAPSGIKASYTYDGAGRVLTKKDTDGYNTEEYIYSLLDSGTGLLNIRKKTYTGPVQTSYFEDVSWWNTLGLLRQQTALAGGGSGEDLICAMDGDFMLHDDVRVWLPWPKAFSGGAYIAAAADSSALWYGNAKAYAAKGYEVSNRSRVLSLAQPGYDNLHRNISIKGSTAAQPLLLWQEPDKYHPTATTGIVDHGYYPRGEVAVESTMDEDSRIVAENRDRFGKTLSVQRSMDPYLVPIPKGSPNSLLPFEVLSPTNYIYDYKDRLRAVAGPGVAMSDTLSMWRYSYDSLGRLSSKGIPGSIREYYTYDDEDRVISTLKGDDCVSTDYDAFGRPLAVWHVVAGSSGQGPQPRLMERHVYDSIPAASEHLLAKADSLLGGGVLTITFAEGTPPSYAGLLTLSQYAVLEGDDAVMAGGDSTATVNTAMLYDHKGNPVVTVTEYPSGVISARRDSFNFLGDLYHSTTGIIRGYTYGVADSLKIDILDWQAGYDQRGRIVSEVSSLLLSGAVQAISDTTLYSYDALGRLSGTASTASASAVESGQTPQTISASYAYNLRNQVTSIQNNVGSHNLFSETLLYDTMGETGYSPSYTGLVTQRSLIWRDDRQPAFGTPAVSITHEEGYEYDAAERIKESGGQWYAPRPNGPKKQGSRFAYDDRGNMLSEVVYNGWITESTRTYSYSGDQLVSLSDDGGLTQVEFYYDSQGRMIYDGTTGMEIAYNHLDLPKNISTGSDILVNYSYLANGAKLGALTPGGSGLVYIGPMVYFRDITGNLSFESTAVAAGRMTAAGLQYQLRDHLGSTVAVVKPSGESLEASSYAAFGERTSNPEEVILIPSSSQAEPVLLRHHFTGKEDQTMFGPGMPYIDFGARHYSAPLRRWLTPDPLSEKYYDTTPYAYCANNPVNFVDPEGFEKVPGAPKELLGTPEYYVWREKQYRERTGVAHSYYEKYGFENARRFQILKATGLLSTKGNIWIDEVMLNLQLEMESSLEKAGENGTEYEESKSFEIDAFNSHPKSYYNMGGTVALTDLKTKELLLILSTPKVSDILSSKGLNQVKEVASYLFFYWSRNPIVLLKRVDEFNDCQKNGFIDIVINLVIQKYGNDSERADSVFTEELEEK